jgi:uncharacterized delta-60 repeat protein
MTRSARTFLLAATFLAAAAPCLAQDDGGRPTFEIEPDRRFGRGGVVRTIRAGRLRLDAVLHARFDAEGRIVVAGCRHLRSRGRIVESAPLVARLFPDGRLDAEFGEGGIATLALRGSPTGLDVDSQGRIVVSGGFGPSVLAVRLRSDGAFDRSFSGDGFLDASGTSVSSLRGVRAVPADDSLLAVAVRDDRTSAVVRIAQDGRLDPKYAGDGFADLSAFPLELAIDSQGRAVFATRRQDGVIRLAADGSRDAAFGAEGALRDAGGAPVDARAVLFDERERIVVHDSDQAVDPGLRRFLADGAPDSSFGDAGFVPTPAGGSTGEIASQTAMGASAKADRVVVASTIVFRDPGRDGTDGHGWRAQLLERAAPGRVATFVGRDPPRRGGFTRTVSTDVLVAPDGRAAYVVGLVETVRGHSRDEVPFVTRLDLARVTRRPAPDLVVEWAQEPRLDDRLELEGAFRARNVGRAASPGIDAAFFLSTDAALDGFDRPLFRAPIVRLAAGAARRFRMPEGLALGPDARGMRILVALQSAVADPSRRIAVSAPIE